MSLLICNKCGVSDEVKDAEDAERLGWHWIGKNIDLCSSCWREYRDFTAGQAREWPG